VFWSKYSDSHEDIIKEFKLHEGTGGLTDNANFVRVEISPEVGKLNTPIKTWKYNLDQSVHPSWYDAEKVEQSCRKELKLWHKQKVILKDCAELKDGHYHIVGAKNVIIRGNSKAELWENSTAVLWENSTAVLWGNSKVELWENSKAELWGNSTAVLWENSKAELWENSTAELLGNSKAELWENSTAILWENSKAEKVGQEATIIVYTTIDPSCLKSDKAVMIDRSGKAVRVFTGGRELK
jgi:hypothetical protein